MHSDVLNWDNSAAFPTPWAPIMQTEYESNGPGPADISLAADDFMGLAGLGGIKLELRDLRRLNESPLFTMPSCSNIVIEIKTKI